VAQEARRRDREAQLVLRLVPGGMVHVRTNVRCCVSVGVNAVKSCVPVQRARPTGRARAVERTRVVQRAARVEGARRRARRARGTGTTRATAE
jgi:hypothetical protein